MKRRLRGLDEFVLPDFVGRMGRIARRKKAAWLAMLFAAVIAGSLIGLLL
jgi:hypothetical protein